MQLTAHFSLAELTATSTGLPNIPSDMELARVRVLAELLEQARGVLGHPVIVSSGYRSEMVNRAVGGSSSSAHMQGLAADFTCPAFGSPKEICIALIDAGLKFDQMILEYRINSKTPGGDWVHLGLREARRQQVKTRLTDGRYVPGLHGMENTA